MLSLRCSRKGLLRARQIALGLCQTNQYSLERLLFRITKLNSLLINQCSNPTDLIVSQLTGNHGK